MVVHTHILFPLLVPCRRLEGLDLGDATSAPWEECEAPSALQFWQPDATVRVVGGTAVLPSAAPPATLEGYGVKARLARRWRAVHGITRAPASPAAAVAMQSAAGGGAGAGAGDFLDGQQQGFFALVNTYCDVMHPAKPYPTDAGGWDGWERSFCVWVCACHRLGCAVGLGCRSP